MLILLITQERQTFSLVLPYKMRLAGCGKTVYYSGRNLSRNQQFSQGRWQGDFLNRYSCELSTICLYAARSYFVSQAVNSLTKGGVLIHPALDLLAGVYDCGMVSPAKRLPDSHT